MLHHTIGLVLNCSDMFINVLMESMVVLDELFVSDAGDDFASAVAIATGVHLNKIIEKLVCIPARRFCKIIVSDDRHIILLGLL